MITWTLILMLGSDNGYLVAERLIPVCPFQQSKAVKSASQSFLNVAPASSISICVERPSIGHYDEKIDEGRQTSSKVGQ